MSTSLASLFRVIEAKIFHRPVFFEFPIPVLAERMANLPEMKPGYELRAPETETDYEASFPPVHARLLRHMAYEARPRPHALQGRRSSSRSRPTLFSGRQSQGSPSARTKAAKKRTEDGQPVHSFRTLLQDLANLTRNTVRLGDALPVIALTRPTPLHAQALKLLGVKLPSRQSRSPLPSQIKPLRTLKGGSSD